MYAIRSYYDNVYLRLSNASAIELRGAETSIPLAGGEKRRIDFALLTEATRLTKPLPVTLQLVDGHGMVQAEADIYLTDVVKMPADRLP